MYDAQLSFAIFKTFGVWRPVHWSSFLAIWIYNLYTAFMILLIYSFNIFLFVYLVYSLSDIDEFVENSFWSIAIFGVCFKMASILLQRDDIIALRKMFQTDWCQPRDGAEEDIQNKYDVTGRITTISFLIFVNATTISMSLSPLIKGTSASLIFNAWVPYDLSRRLMFWFTYANQSIGLIASGCLSVATESFATVMMLQICVQLEIISHRLGKLPQLCNNNGELMVSNNFQESKILRECIRHHNHVYLFGERLNKIFSFILLIQFGGAIIDICTSVYQLSTISMINIKFFSLLFCSASILMQIFLYCWYGNEVTLKSLEVGHAAYMIDWTLLTNKIKQDLIFLIARARRPIFITGGSIVTMNIQTLVSIMKTSYAVFNLLKK